MSSCLSKVVCRLLTNSCSVLSVIIIIIIITNIFKAIFVILIIMDFMERRMIRVTLRNLTESPWGWQGLSRLVPDLPRRTLHFHIPGTPAFIISDMEVMTRMSSHWLWQWGCERPWHGMLRSRQPSPRIRRDCKRSPCTPPRPDQNMWSWKNYRQLYAQKAIWNVHTQAWPQKSSNTISWSNCKN